MGSRITAIEYFLPETVLDNNQLAQEFGDWDATKIERKTGIRSRHISAPGQTSLDLAASAGELLFQRVDRQRIDFLIVCTETPDYFIPPNACLLQDRLGLPRSVGAFDFSMGCSGFIYGLSLAKGLIAAQTARCVLLITAETYSKIIHPQDRVNRTIFGDGAAATLVEASDSENIGHFVFGTDGSGAHHLKLENGAFRNQYDPASEAIEYGSSSIYTHNHLYMNGPEIFNFMIATIPLLVDEVLAKNATTRDDIDYVIFHQANKYMLEYVRDKMKLPKDKFHIDMVNTGNTVSATLPIAIKDCLARGNIIPGQRVLLCGFGVGLSWAGTIITA